MAEKEKNPEKPRVTVSNPNTSKEDMKEALATLEKMREAQGWGKKDQESQNR